MKIGEFVLSCFSNSQCYSCKQEGHCFCRQCREKIERYKPYCYVCKKYSENFMIHDSCKKIFPNIESIIVLTRYRTPVTKKILRLGKYHNKKEIYKALIEGNIDFFAESVTENNSIIVPVPMHFIRRWKRGYNQAEIIARHLSKGLEIPMKTNFLIKKKYTKQQSKLTMKKRYENLEGSFILKNMNSIAKNTKIYLIDDIVSTGSTLGEISNILAKNGYKNVSALCIASD